MYALVLLYPCFTTVLPLSINLLLYSCFYSCFTYIYICFTPVCLLLYIYILDLCFAPALPLSIYLSASIMLHWNICIFYCCFTPISYQRSKLKQLKGHLALVFKGLPVLKHFIVELKHIITPTKLPARSGEVGVTIYIYMLYSFRLTL